MYAARLEFTYSFDCDTDEFQFVDFLLHSLRFNGQILGKEHIYADKRDGLVAYVYIAEIDALDSAHHSSYVSSALARLEEYGIRGPEIRILDELTDMARTCRCENPDTLVLSISHPGFSSPLTCTVCDMPFPLYRIRDDSGSTRVHEYLIPWISDCESLDRLFMNDTHAVRSAYRQLSSIDSPLTVSGRMLCQRIEQLTGAKIYYDLYRHHGRSWKSERSRPCPSCGKEWFLESPWLGTYHFRCDECRLVSTIALDVYIPGRNFQPSSTPSNKELQ